VIIDVFDELKKPSGPFASLKSNNALMQVMAGIARKKKGLDEMLILNEEGYLCEAIAANLFVWYGKVLYTPALSEGCVDGVMRRAIIELTRQEGYEVVEAQIRPEILQEADELFLTNAINGINWVMGYKKKRYFNHLSRQLQDKLNKYGLEEEY
jgi:branched-chain amino acid aminotransferase